MIPNPFTRSINVCTTILVIALHGLTVWAVTSMDSSVRPKIKLIEPKVIQLELITLPAENVNIEPKSEAQSEPQLKPQPEKKVAEPVEKDEPELLSVEPSDPIEPTQPTETIKPLKHEPEEEKTKLEAKSEAKSEKEGQSEEAAETYVSAQVLIIKETKSIIKTKATTGEEMDLDAMIRAVSAQFNRDQARQWQEAIKRAERDRLQAQASKLDKRQKQAAADDEPVDSSKGQGSWLDGHEPNTSLPSGVWRNTDAKSGEVFIVLLELQVDKDGYITEVQLLESSGNQVIDAVATVQVRTGQLNPLQKNGLPIDGIVPMSLMYKRP